MTVFSDAVGNYYLGDAQYANHSLSYPNLDYLISNEELVSGDNSLFTEFFTGAGFSYSSVPAYSPSSSFTYFSFSPNNYSDTANHFSFKYAFTQPGGSPTRNFIVDGSGYTGTSTGFASFVNTSASTGKFHFFEESTDPDYSGKQLFMMGNDNCLGMVAFNTRFSTGVPNGAFWYAGILTDVNTEYGYFSSSDIYHSLYFSAGQFELATNSINGKTLEPTTTTLKGILTTGKAIYSITCSDAQTPTTQWATDLYVFFDDDGGIGTPAIGRVRNMLIAQGSYTMGKPVKISGSVMPDLGHNHWLPVQNWGTYTLLMRCYSSVV